MANYFEKHLVRMASRAVTRATIVERNERFSNGEKLKIGGGGFPSRKLFKRRLKFLRPDCKRKAVYGSHINPY